VSFSSLTFSSFSIVDDERSWEGTIIPLLALIARNYAIAARPIRNVPIASTLRDDHDTDKPAKSSRRWAATRFASWDDLQDTYTFKVRVDEPLCIRESDN
jgi:hypothetical protein